MEENKNNSNNEISDIKKQLSDITQLVSSFISENKTKETNQKKEPQYLGDTINKEISDRYQKEELSKKAYRAAQFNTDLKPFIEGNAKTLGEDVVFTFQRINDENIKDPELKMKYFQKELGEKIIAQRQFADLLNDDLEARRKYEEFQTLSRDEKIEQGQKIWDIAKEMVERNKYVRKQEEISKGNISLNTSKNADTKFENKIRSTAYKWLGKDLGTEIVPLVGE